MLTSTSGYGAYNLESDCEEEFKVNGQQLNHYLGVDFPRNKTVLISD